VRLQIEVAEGRALSAAALAPRRDGHAIEVRLYAEVASEDGLRPATGAVHRFAFDEQPGLRIDAGVADGSVVGVHYDPMLAKVIAHAPTRGEAARVLARALRRMRLHGVGNNRDLLVGILEHDEFLAGATDTHFLERHAPASLAAAARDGVHEGMLAVAAALAGQAERRAAAQVLRTLPSGWRNVGALPLRVELATDRHTYAVAYRLARGGLEVELDGERLADLVLREATASCVVLQVGSVVRRFAIARAGDRVFVDGVLGSAEFRELPRHPSGELELAPGSLVAPMPGIVLRVNVAVGDPVAAKDELLVLEAMKMEHRITAPVAGTVATIHVAAGDNVAAGTPLIVLAVDEASGESDG
jgi:acetyl/propionyl-CoA carboxylase alpha subunit